MPEQLEPQVLITLKQDIHNSILPCHFHLFYLLTIKAVEERDDVSFFRWKILTFKKTYTLWVRAKRYLFTIVKIWLIKIKF